MFLMKFYNFMTDDEKLFQSLLLVDNVSYKIMAFKPKRRLESFNPYFSWTMFFIEILAKVNYDDFMFQSLF